MSRQSTIISQTRTFVDKQTGRTIRQLTDLPHGAHLGYFRFFRQLPDGRLLAKAAHEHGNTLIIDPDSGELELLPYTLNTLKHRESDGRHWFMSGVNNRELWFIDLPDGTPVHVADIPDSLPGVIEDITIDGTHLIARATEEDLVTYPIPTTMDLDAMFGFLRRPRNGSLWAYCLATGEQWEILHLDGLCPLHTDTSPLDPGLIRYCQDMPETEGQRIWTVRLDGSERRPIRVQARGEMITHEYWWSDANLIGFTYQDRRRDATLPTNPWAEYAPVDTRLGLADLAGNEVYLSDPLNCYHSHLYRSPDGRFVSGEGTHSHSFVYAAPFSLADTHIAMTPLATIHTPYIPFRGQMVDCNFSADSRWLIYADQLAPGAPHQLFAVAVDLQ